MKAKLRRRGLSKSRIQTGLRCKKALYLTVHHPELATPDNAELDRVQADGHAVGAAAWALYPDGTLIDGPWDDVPALLKKTSEAIQSGACTLYEAAFQVDGTLVRVDILHRTTKKASWQIIEVKQGGKAKETYKVDAAIQAHIVKDAGLAVGRVCILHLDTSVALTAKGVKPLFRLTDVTSEFRRRRAGIAKTIAMLRKLLSRKSAPKAELDRRCWTGGDYGYDCPFFDHCKRAARLPKLSVLDLRGIRNRWELLADGKVALNQVTEEDVGEQNARMIRAHLTKRPWIDRGAMRTLLQDWSQPVHTLDFETLQSALPKFIGTRPHEKVAFQFSGHVVGADGRATEVSYLHPDDSNPREALARALIRSYPKRGSIAAYNKGFEASQITALEKAFPKLAPALASIRERLVDPWDVLEASYYHPRFEFSYSLKTVAPVLLGKDGSYANLAIQGGDVVPSLYTEFTHPACLPRRKAEIMKNLLEYCSQDSRVTLEIVRWLFKQADMPAKRTR